MPPRAARAIASYIPSSLPQISSAGTRSSAGAWDRSVHFDWKWAHDVDGGDKDNQLGDLGRGPAVGGEQARSYANHASRADPIWDLTRRSNTARSAADTVTVLMRLAMALPSADHNPRAQQLQLRTTSFPLVVVRN